MEKQEAMKKKQSRSKRAYYNMIASGTYEIVVFVISLFVPRAILEAFGSADNGLILSITQFLGYISFVTLGVAGPTRVALYKSLSINNIKETSSVLKATDRFYKRVSRLFILYIIILSVGYPLIVESEHEWYEVALLVVIIGGGMFAEYCFGMTYQSLVHADQKQYVYYTIKIVTKVLDAFVAIILIHNGATLFVVKVGTAIFNTVTPVFLYIYVHKKYILLHNVEANTKVLDQRKDAAASSIANIIHNNIDVALLSILANTMLVSVYSVYMLVMNGLTSIMKVFTSTLEAPFGNVWARNEHKVLNTSMEIYEYLMFAFVSVIFTCTARLVGPFVLIYTKVVNDINYDIPEFAYLLTLSTAVYCLRQPYITLVQAAGKYKDTRNANIMEAILNFFISIILIKPLGLIGITLGTLIANLYRTISYSIYSSKYLLNRSYTVVLKRTIWLLLTSGVIIILYMIIPQVCVASDWITWALLGCEAFIISFTVTLLSSLLFYKKNLIQSLQYFKKMIC